MFSLYQTPLDYLYLVLSVGVGLLALVLVIATIELICILGNFRRVSAKAKDTVDLINHYLWQPIKIMLMVVERMKEMKTKHTKKQ